MSAETENNSINLAAELRRMIASRFDTHELHRLASDMGIDYDDLPGEGKSRKIVELIQLLSRQERIPQLIELCKRERPQVNWQPLLDAAHQEPLSFAVLDTLGDGDEPPASPTLLQNKPLLFGLGGLLLIIIVGTIFLFGGGDPPNDFDGDEGLLLKIESLVSNPNPQTQFDFSPGLPGWQGDGFQLTELGDVRLAPQASLLRDKTFRAGQGILLDFTLSNVDNDEPAITFSLQNAQDPAQATRVITLQATTQPQSSALENGEAMMADQFARNTNLAANVDYTMTMGLDENGRFVASIFGFSVDTEEDAIFIYEQPAEWADETWWFHIDTGNQGAVDLLGGWEFNFDTVR